MLLATIVWITLCAVALLGYYLRVIPTGPACPRCGQPGQAVGDGVTGRGTPSLLRGYLFEARCPACGWEGRFRSQAPVGAVLEENPNYGRGG